MLTMEITTIVLALWRILWGSGLNIDKIVRCLCKSKCFISFLDMKIKYINTHKIVIASQHFSKMKHFDYACCNVNEIVTDINMHINKVIKYL